MKNEKNYNIGLDIGVASVGWCVTDEENNIIKRNGKNMWGARIFDEAQTAKDRRIFRSTRRRLNRRKERINILQSLMKEDLDKNYPNFLPMLRETSNIKEDKTISESVNGIKYNLFSQLEMTDKEYYKKFPTIYHLRKYLVETNEKVDIRLVYLAIHHIIKYRGNFLHEGNFAENTNEVLEKLDILLEYLKENYDINLVVENNEILEILIQKNISKANKKDKLINCFNFEKEDKQLIVNILNSILGYSFDINKIFNIEIEENKISFSNDIENEEEIYNILNEQVEIYDAMKTIYSWYVLQDILKGKTYISDAFIEKYSKYSNDLKLLKKVYKTYFPSEYNNMFRKSGNDNYVAYNGKNCKKCNADVFLNMVKKKIATLPECYEKEKILENIENDEFLKKINSIENGAIPHQLHKKELEKILENQSVYYKTIQENKNNILELFEFKIPYYVGPLSKKPGKWSWVIRKEEGIIRPWNFNKIIDEDATAEEFIRRMTNKCTYILNEDVIPKQSILYSKFCVLNELNNIRIDGNHIENDMKKKVIEMLFMKNKKVTVNMLKNLYKHEGFDVKIISGLSNENSFNSNMNSYIDMKNIFGYVDETNIEQCERLIYLITIFEEKKILKRKIEKEFKNLTENQIKSIMKKRYTGWSRLSKRLLIGLKSYDNETIMEKLEKTTMNFMQIINKEEFGFNKQLEELMPKISKNITYKDINEIPTSPANKRAIWQTICIIKEITKIMKKEPNNIYIEFARNEERNKEMKDNRAKQLLKKYEEINNQVKELKNFDYNVYKELKKHQSDKMLKEKMYLYFIQNGKCLYSGKALNIDELSNYEVDHILPQSYIKDDSIDNKALVIRQENQRKKDNLLLADEIIDNRMEWWKGLLEAGLISQTKFYRLIKRKIFETDDEREKFVQRQLVETRQITKYVTNLLKNTYNSNIYALRAELTHGFRMKYKLYKNRNINNYHHAQDAYILNIIGNTIDKNWNGTENFKYGDYVKKYFKDDKNKLEKNGIILGFVGKYINIEKIKKTMNYKDCYVTRMLQEQTGEFYNQTLYSPSKKPVIPLKNNKSPEKYGGYSGENKAYYVIFGYINNKDEQEYQLIGVPVQVAYKIKDKKENIENYIISTYLKDKTYSNFKVIRNKILKNQQYLDENNEIMRFCSDVEIRPDKELIVNEKMNELIYLMNLNEDKLDDNEKEKLESNYEYMFNYLTEKIEKEYKCLALIKDKLNTKREIFKNLDNCDKNLIINGLINLMETGQGNLKLLEMGDREGRKSGQNFNTKRLLNMTFIDKSITGIYERRYKINGMENSCSK